MEKQDRRPPDVAKLPAPSAVGERLNSLDTYRGLTMILLAFTVPNYDWAARIATKHTDAPLLARFLRQFDHVEWQGLVLWDMIQPSFMFMVGVSLVYSCNSRLRRGHSFARMLFHAVFRSIFLVLLGVFLRSLDTESTNWTYEDVVTQIGLGYVPLFLLWRGGRIVQLSALAVILVGTWLLFALWPITPENTGFYNDFFAHWNITGNPWQYVDQWFLNLFPRDERFVANDDGYYTLNFIPSIGTMIFGLLAGNVLYQHLMASVKLRQLLTWGGVALATGVLLEVAGICPIVKKIWTPSFVLVSGGICLWTLAILYYCVDMLNWDRISFPARVVGMNSMAMYIMVHTTAGWLARNLETHLGTKFFALWGNAYQPLFINLTVGVCLWLICFWMYKRQIFLRI